jgi:hypothetical protein
MRAPPPSDRYHLCHATTLAELLLSVLEDTVTALDAYGGAIILADPATGQLDLAHAVSIPEHRPGAGKSLPAGRFDARHVALPPSFSPP